MCVCILFTFIYVTKEEKKEKQINIGQKKQCDKSWKRKREDELEKAVERNYDHLSLTIKTFLITRRTGIWELKKKQDMKLNSICESIGI